MIKCEELNREFDSKQGLFKALKENKKTLLAKKKSEIKTKRNAGVLGFMDMKDNTVKGIPNMDDNYIYPVISNTNYLDSHKDVHLNGSMNKTAKDQNKKVYYVADHKLEVDSVIATPKNVEVILMNLSWKDLGRNYGGNTEALVFKIAKDKIMHDKFLKMIQEEEDLQNSIRMMYINLDIAINSTDEEFKEEFKVWSEVYPKIANKNDFEDLDYFWAIRELKLYMEGSAVLYGSNDATPTKSNIEPPEGTQNPDPEAEKSLHQNQINYYLNI